MDLGAFSLSLAVKDLETSRKFYEAFGFTTLDGQPDQGWLILQNGAAKIGLFQGMFDQNIITFHPPDARAVQAGVVAAGYTPSMPAADGDGPAMFMITDPDGNGILVDQH